MGIIETDAFRVKLDDESTAVVNGLCDVINKTDDSELKQVFGHIFDDGTLKEIAKNKGTSRLDNYLGNLLLTAFVNGVG